MLFQSLFVLSLSSARDQSFAYQTQLKICVSAEMEQVLPQTRGFFIFSLNIDDDKTP